MNPDRVEQPRQRGFRGTQIGALQVFVHFRADEATYCSRRGAELRDIENDQVPGTCHGFDEGPEGTIEIDAGNTGKTRMKSAKGLQCAEAGIPVRPSRGCDPEDECLVREHATTFQSKKGFPQIRCGPLVQFFSRGTYSLLPYGS
jgi:hypothetical protein